MRAPAPLHLRLPKRNLSFARPSLRLSSAFQQRRTFCVSERLDVKMNQFSTPTQPPANFPTFTPDQLSTKREYFPFIASTIRSRPFCGLPVFRLSYGDDGLWDSYMKTLYEETHTSSLRADQEYLFPYFFCPIFSDSPLQDASHDTIRAKFTNWALDTRDPTVKTLLSEDGFDDFSRTMGITVKYGTKPMPVRLEYNLTDKMGIGNCELDCNLLSYSHRECLCIKCQLNDDIFFYMPPGGWTITSEGVAVTTTVTTVPTNAVTTSNQDYSKWYTLLGHKNNTATATKAIKSTPISAAASASITMEPGYISTCDKYYKVVSGESCYSIAQTYRITLDEFYTWNPDIGDDCSGLWLGYGVCVGISSTTSSITASATSS
ncbi:hypothetical protein N7478_011076 [Penicillium angulare]|uniref:uncharacterized protein n=1 Tax=Penicillium angulare TaxID=116970 RepID=UPI0025407626|nr:uncharacterized protein N7478_011076 [Penicillium angulare]KAJ5263471.1 hypothetical protein N7478_011076 [Penicillium angulare]